VVAEGGGSAPVAAALARLLGEAPASGPGARPGAGVLVVSGGNLDPARVVALAEERPHRAGG
jgi:hypothetical protein